MLEFDDGVPKSADCYTSPSSPILLPGLKRLIRCGSLVMHGGSPQQLGYRGSIRIPF